VDHLSSEPASPAAIGLRREIERLADGTVAPAGYEEHGWRFGLPQLFLLVLAAAILFGSARAFGWQHYACNGPLFLVVAFLARGRRVEVLCLEVLIFSAIVWGLALLGAL